MMPRNDRNKTLENITIAFRNFAGKPDQYNAAGNRNFAILLDEPTARDLEQDGWNVKYLRVREEGDEPQAYIQVNVSYKKRPPKICMVTSKTMSYLTEDEIELLDWADIETADVTLYPYEWVVNGKSGVKAYVHAFYVKIEEDYLQAKWTAYIEDNKKDRLQLEASNDYIDGEVVYEPRQIESPR
jgi:hypothetical protein